MRVSWKAVSHVDEADNSLLLVTFRTELDCLVTEQQLQTFLKDVEALQEQNVISPETYNSANLQFETIHALLRALQESLVETRRARLETPWQDFPLDEWDDLAPAIKRSFASDSAIRLDGKAPNYTVNYQLGTLTRAFPVPPAELEPSATFLATLTAASLQLAADEVSARQISPEEALAAIGVVAAGTVITVGATYGVTIAIGALASGAITAAQAEVFLKAVAAGLTAAAAAYKLYLEHEKAKADRAEEQRLRREQIRSELETTRIRIIAGDDISRVAGIV